MSTPGGWNYNLTKRCVKSPLPGLPNYYEETPQCDSTPFPGLPTHYWTVAVSSEFKDGSVCPEPAAQSFLINGQGSPVTLGWFPHTDEFGNTNWAVNMKTDLYNYQHPCGGNHFNWYAFMDHTDLGGGPLPNPDRLRFSAVVNFNDYLLNGASRALVEFNGYWAGKPRYVDVAFCRTNWGDNYPDDPMIYELRDTPQMTYISVRGSYFGIEIPKGVDSLVSVNWGVVLSALINAGHLVAFDGHPETHMAGISHETHNWSATGSAVSDMWFTNFRIEEV